MSNRNLDITHALFLAIGISSMQKEAIDFLKREFGSAFWSSNRTAETVEEYYEQGDNWDRAVVYAWGEVDPSRLYQQGEKDDDEDDDEDDEDDDEDDDEVVAEAVTGGEGGGEGEKETAKPTDGDTTDGNTSTVASEGDSENNSVEKATKTDAEVTKVQLRFSSRLVLACSWQKKLFSAGCLVHQDWSSRRALAVVAGAQVCSNGLAL